MQLELFSIPQTNIGIELLSIIDFNVVFIAVLEWLFALNVVQYISRDMTKPTKWSCAQRRLRSALASAHSDQSSLSAWWILGSLATQWAHSEDWLGECPGWSVFARRTAILLVLSWGGWYGLYCWNHVSLSVLDYRKNPKISDTRKFAVITLKLEQNGFSLEYGIQKMQREWQVWSGSAPFAQICLSKNLGTLR